MLLRPNSFLSLSARPSAYLPIAMSLSALAVVAVRVAMFGSGHDPDEGAAAHLWQLLMVGQLPILGYFALRWLPRVPRQSVIVMMLQLVVAAAAVAPVYLLGL